MASFDFDARILAPVSPAAQALRARKKAKQALGQNILWYIIAGVVGALFFIRVISLLRAFVIRRRASANRSNLTPTPTPISTSSPSGFSTAARATKALYANYLHVRVFPLWIFSHSSATEILVTATYTGVVISVTLWSSVVDGKMDFKNPMGHAAFAQLPLIVGLASKNNTLSFLTGISYEKLNYLHRAAGRVCVLTSWIHCLAFVVGGIPPTSKFFITGMIAWVALSLMFVSSIALVRRAMYELFLIIHILMAVTFLVGCWFHARSSYFQIWIWAAMTLWGLDRFVSLAKLAWVNKAWLKPLPSHWAFHSACEVELVDSDVVRVHVNRPNLLWKAGQHAYLTMPGVAALRYEQHPFTIANVPDESGDAVFLIRAQNGFTRRLVDHLSSTTSGAINAYIDGPYGTPEDLNHYAGVLLITAGTGITYGLAHLASIIKASRKGESAVSQVRLVWNVRQMEHIRWIVPMLNHSLARGTGNVAVAIDIFVTRSHLSDEPNTTGPDSPGVSPSETPLYGVSPEAGNSYSPEQRYSNPRPAPRTPLGCGVSPITPPPPARCASRSEEHISDVSFHSNPCTTASPLPLRPMASPSSFVLPIDTCSEKSVSLDSDTASSNSLGLGGKKYGHAYGLSPVATAVTSFHRGRGNAELLLRTDVDAVPSDAAGVAVGVCGPVSLTQDVRRAVTEVNSVKAVLAGQNPIDLYSETFGW